MMKDSGREELSDKKFDTHIEEKEFSNKLFSRLVAKGIKFSKIDFKYCIFDGVYLRNCSFDSCDFTGCRFINSNLHGSGFNGCKFDYATFDKTFIDDDVLETGCPGYENLKLKFSRSLRMNYQQIGDAKAVNKAIKIELQATEDHLHKAWASKESYYRKKYKGLSRFTALLEWLEFKALDFVWGNGESTWKLFRAVAFVLLLVSILDIFNSGDLNNVSDYLTSMCRSPQILLGVLSPEYFSPSLLTLIFTIRLILFGFFMSIIIKRFNRR